MARKKRTTTETLPPVFRERFSQLIQKIDVHQARVDMLKEELQEEKKLLVSAQQELFAIARKAVEGLPLFEQASQ